MLIWLSSALLNFHATGSRRPGRIAGGFAKEYQNRTGTNASVGKDRKNPVKDKQKLVEELRKALDDATAFCAQHQVVLADIEKIAVGSLERLHRIEDALNALISPDPVRRDFLGHEWLVTTLYRAVKPDPAALEFAGRVACIGTIADAIRAKLNPNPTDISEVMGDINSLLDKSITGMTIREPGPPALDLSKINFEALASRFRESKHKNADLEVLKAKSGSC
jgi:type I restriction enzyme, R subunit